MSETIICQLLSYEDKKKTPKNCKGKKANMFANVDFSQKRLERKKK